ncbi:hypothetical protein [Sulfuricurvum sp.]|uniref:hypothetical protein n=1 Tax=Sulfuricurvum sp. TaxID=2025608 RepID=UPI003564D775
MIYGKRYDVMFKGEAIAAFNTNKEAEDHVRIIRACMPEAFGSHSPGSTPLSIRVFDLDRARVMFERAKALEKFDKAFDMNAFLSFAYKLLSDEINGNVEYQKELGAYIGAFYP